MDRSDSLVYESPKLPLEVALLRGCFQSARILLTNGCSTFAGLVDLLKNIEDHCESQDTLQELTKLVSQPKTLKVIAKHFVVESLAANNICSAEMFNTLVNSLPVLNKELKEQLSAKFEG